MVNSFFQEMSKIINSQDVFHIVASFLSPRDVLLGLEQTCVDATRTSRILDDSYWKNCLFRDFPLYSEAHRQKNNMTFKQSYLLSCKLGCYCCGLVASFKSGYLNEGRVFHLCHYCEEGGIVNMQVAKIYGLSDKTLENMPYKFHGASKMYIVKMIQNVLVKNVFLGVKPRKKINMDQEKVRKRRLSKMSELFKTMYNITLDESYIDYAKNTCYYNDGVGLNQSVRHVFSMKPRRNVIKL